MKKLFKLIKRPRQFFADAYFNKYPERKHKKTLAQIELSHKLKKPTAILIGFSDWKSWMDEVLPEFNVVYLGHSPRVSISLLQSIPKFFQPHVFCWSYKFPESVNDLCRRSNIPITFVEDGFIRGSGLGVEKTKPMSLVFDQKAMHFDSSKISELDDLLNHHDISELDTENAQMLREAFEAGVTKYIRADSDSDLSSQLDLQNEHVVVVLGQVEDDLSIQFGSDRFYSGNDLVLIAALENPGSRILYRPHPEAIARRKKHYSNPEDVASLCDIIGRKWSLKESLEVSNRVYTVTSFSGFEAALMGKEVDLFGLPFYGGWGFTNDRHKIDMSRKRKRQLTVDQVLSITLGRYAKYYNPITMEHISPAKAVSFAKITAANLTSYLERKHKKTLAQIEERELARIDSLNHGLTSEPEENSQIHFHITLDLGTLPASIKEVRNGNE